MGWWIDNLLPGLFFGYPYSAVVNNKNFKFKETPGHVWLIKNELGEAMGSNIFGPAELIRTGQGVLNYKNQKFTFQFGKVGLYKLAKTITLKDASNNEVLVINKKTLNRIPDEILYMNEMEDAIILSMFLMIFYN